MKSLLKYNTFGIDQSCREIYEPKTVNEARDIISTIKDSDYLLLGSGSNLLLTKDFDGNVLHSQIKGIEILSKNETSSTIDIRCGSGEVWDDVVSYAVSHNMYGIENLSIIPGEVGASAVQNIGAYGVEAKDVIYKIEAIEIATGKDVVFENKDCDYSYRYSKFKSEWKNKYFITYVTYRLNKSFEPHIDYGNLRSILNDSKLTAQIIRDTIIEVRNAKLPDPKIEGNAGSFFMNPVVSQEKFESLQKEYPNIPHYLVASNENTDDSINKVKIPAGWMIDRCGWKGKTLGRAGVHNKQALVLVNKGGATGAEIVKLCDAIRVDVFNKFGIMIHPEVNII